MSGHSKWSTIKRAKGALDAKRGKIFSKLSHEISVASKEGGGDADLNPRLRQAIAAAKKENMPKDTIEKAVKKGSGELEGAAFEEATYEGFAPGGVALIVEVTTDNKNRSAADIRNIFNKNNGSMGTSGSVAYLFERRGEIRLALDSGSEDDILDLALEAGADDVSLDEEHHIIHTTPDELSKVSTALRERDVEIASQQLVYLPQNLVEVDDRSTATQILRLYEILDDYDDTLNVFANFDIPDSVLEAALA
ncbi:MAG: YebC/PmpR family DNA-binding transcriptional regulator [Verrucomicrobiales bacterium]